MTRDFQAQRGDKETHVPQIEFAPRMANSELIRLGREYLDAARAQAAEAGPKISGRALCHRLSRAHDVLLRALYRHVSQRWESEGRKSPGSICMASMGGYGRRELCLHSDVDVVFLLGRRKPDEDFLKAILHTLFDWKMEVGHAVRRVEDCVETIGVDLESATSLIEARWLAGSRPLFQHAMEVFHRALRGSGRRWFVQGRYREWNERREKFDASVYLLQPNLKEGAGGLRDIHAVRWLLLFKTGSGDLAQLENLGILTSSELRRLLRAEEFVLKLRNELHALSPRKTDVLSFEAQMEITRRFGVAPSKTALAEEVLMRDYYRRARDIARFASRAFSLLLRSERGALGSVLGTLRRRRIDRHFLSSSGAIFLDAKYPEFLAEDPRRIMELFARARRLGLRVSERTRDCIEAIVPSIDEEFGSDPINRKHFLEILGADTGVARTLNDMHDCRFLSAYIPEFEHVRCMVRMDYYHRYTVDEHLIKAVEIAERLRAESGEDKSHAAAIAQEIQRPDLLNLSLLLHDVGKGYGKGHAILGGQLIQRIGQRMGLEDEDVDTLRFLVLSHLKIGHVSQRRDLDDPAVAHQLAEEIGTPQRLKLLYVHSVCDLMAVSPEAMTEWRSGLFAACYRATAAAMSGQSVGAAEPSASPEAIAGRVWEHLDSIKKIAAGDEAALSDLRRRLDEFLHSVPPRYLQSTHLEYVAEHFAMLQKLDEKNRILWQLHGGYGVSELSVCSADTPGSFAMTCGALAAKNINICSAEIYSTRDGYAINRFQLTDLENKPLASGFRLDRLRHDLNQVFLANKPMEELIERYSSHSFAVPAYALARPTEVRIDNEGSQEYTILEIRTADRPGLLYRIALLFDRHKLNIYRAMLSTEAYGVIDVFYLTDLEYNKLHDPKKLETLIDRLKEELDGPRIAEHKAQPPVAASSGSTGAKP